jgi:transposase-like protein
MVVFAFTNVCTHVPEKKKLEHNSVQQPPCSTCGETYARDNLYNMHEERLEPPIGYIANTARVEHDVDIT